ncbi:MAG: ATP-binding protein [Cyanobacterium sp. T60_A2020_053]|nr:ATP-binding protein [Cyanobacterium sp. T60_A2020_053]
MNKLTVSAHLDSLKTIAEYVVKVAKSADLEKKATYKLRLAVDELATNIINYAYIYKNAESEKIIELESKVSDHAVIITVIDNGIPFDSTKKLESESETIKKPIEERGIGGLGIFLAFDGVDDFTYQRLDGHNVNILTVYK